MKTTLSFAALFLCSASLIAQDDRSFQPKYEVGRTWTISSRRVLDLDLTITDLEGQKKGKMVNTTIDEKYERQFQKVEAGRPMQVLVKVLQQKISSTQPERTEQTGPLEGKEITIDGSGASGSDLTPEQKTAFRLDEDFEAILPTRAVAPGATWRPDHKEVAKFVLDAFQITPGAEGSCDCKLVSIEKKGDREIATLGVSVDLKGTSTSRWVMTASGSGTLTWDVTNGRPERLNFTGTLDAKGEEADDKGQVVAIVDGHGTFSIVNTYEQR